MNQSSWKLLGTILSFEIAALLPEAFTELLISGGFQTAPQNAVVNLPN